MATLRRVCHTLKLLLFSRGFVQEKSPFMSHAEMGITQSKISYFLIKIKTYMLVASYQYVVFYVTNGVLTYYIYPEKECDFTFQIFQN